MSEILEGRLLAAHQELTEEMKRLLPFYEAYRAVVRAKVGSTIEILVDEVDESGAIGRSRADAPVSSA